MKQITKQQLEQFLKNEGYIINLKVCDEKTLEHSICWSKAGRNKAIVSKNRTTFQHSELQKIFLDPVISAKAVSHFKQSK